MIRCLRWVVIGASRDRAKYGNRAVQAYLRAGWTVYPVSPREQDIESLRCYASILDLPGPVDRATLYVPPAVGLTLIEDIARKGVRELYLNPGANSPELVAKVCEHGLAPLLRCSIIN